MSNIINILHVQFLIALIALILSPLNVYLLSLPICSLLCKFMHFICFMHKLAFKPFTNDQQ